MKNVEIFFVFTNKFDHIIIHPKKISENSIKLSNFGGFDKMNEYRIYVLIKKRHKVYGLEMPSLKIDQDTKLIIGYDTNPYKRDYDWMDKSNKNIDAVIFMENHPQRNGLVTCHSTTITNHRRYMKDGEKLLITL